MSTFEKVKKIVCDKLGVDESKVTESASFVNDLGADSLDAYQIVLKLEDTFDISLPPEKVTKVTTVADAVALIQKERGQKK